MRENMILNLKKTLKQTYVNNILVLVSGATGAKLIVIVSTPLLSRLFDPSEFGFLGVYVSIIGFLTVGSSFRLSRATILPASNKTAYSLFGLSVFALLIFTTIASIIFFVFRNEIANVMDMPNMAIAFMWIAPILFAAGFYEILDHWATRLKGFSQLTKARLCRSTGTTIAQLIAGFLGLSVLGLVGGFVFGVIMGTIIFSIMISRYDNKLLSYGLRVQSWKGFKSLLFEYRHFPMYSLPSKLLSKGAGTAIPILFSILFSPAVAGLYWFTRRGIMLTNDTIVRSIRQAFSQRASELDNNKKKVFRLYYRNTLFLVLIWIPVVIIIVLTGPSLFVLVFGDSWYEAGVYAQWLVVMGLTEFGRAPALEMIYVFNLQRGQFLFEILTTVIRIGSIILGFIFGNPLLAIIFLSISSLVLYAGQIIIVGLIIRSREANKIINLE